MNDKNRQLIDNSILYFVLLLGQTYFYGNKIYYLAVPLTVFMLFDLKKRFKK